MSARSPGEEEEEEEPSLGTASAAVPTRGPFPRAGLPQLFGGTTALLH